ncbi:FtsB/FtsL family cell division protein [Olsenella massiliensis]|uniref:cell division protein FtsL n=1 Tax=Olsenella massiliensis TaxID=1622075 RepID=UPI00071E63F1|nr:cell division protein FtsL [Olsenella massiliensis]
MAYLGSAAYRLDVLEAQPRHDERATFEVLRGGGLDAEARRGVSRAFLARIKVFLACMAFVVVVGSGRVAVSIMTVSSMQANAQTQSSIADAQALNTGLLMAQSQLRASSRIESIATENYGMVASTSAAQVRGSAGNAQTPSQG